MVVLASVAAGVVGRAAFGAQPFLTLPAFHLVSGQVITVAEAMKPLPEPVSPHADLAELTARLLDERRDALPVVDEAGEYHGVVTSRCVEEAMGSNALDVTAASLMVAVRPVQAAASLHDAIAELVQLSRGGVPVVQGERLVGWLGHRDALNAYHRRLQASMGQAARHVPTVGAGSGLPPIPRLGDFRIIDLTLGNGDPSGRRVPEVRWPESSLLLAIRRDGEVIVPGGDTELRTADRLTVLLPAGMMLNATDPLVEDSAPTRE